MNAPQRWVFQADEVGHDGTTPREQEFFENLMAEFPGLGDPRYEVGPPRLGSSPSAILTYGPFRVIYAGREVTFEVLTEAGRAAFARVAQDWLLREMETTAHDSEAPYV